VRGRTSSVVREKPLKLRLSNGLASSKPTLCTPCMLRPVVYRFRFTPLVLFRAMALSSVPAPSLERTADLTANLADVNAKIAQSTALLDIPRPVALLAVSKLKPASDVLACYHAGHRDFGENYVNELVDKASQVLRDLQTHPSDSNPPLSSSPRISVGTSSGPCNRTRPRRLQVNLFVTRPLHSNWHSLPGVPNLYATQTLSSKSTATALNKALPATRTGPLNVLLQVNTSGEASKSGLPSLDANRNDPDAAELDSTGLLSLATHILTSCPRLHLLGLMTIGSWEASHSNTENNPDFERLRATRDLLENELKSSYGERKWGEEGRLLLSMGMSADFEAAIKAGSDVVRVGTTIFGQRP
jgi:pyridoxal phosphate enzyme (YggS family)